MKEKMMKITDRIIIILTSLSLLVWVVGAVVIPLTGSKSYYNYEFNKTNTVEKLHWIYKDDNQVKEIAYDKDDLDLIINHIIDYLSDKSDTLQFEIDGLTVFSNQAIHHMKDVKDLYHTGKTFCTICFVLFLLGCLYIFFRYEHIKSIAFKYSLITVGVIAGIGLIIAICMLIDFKATFKLFHMIIFPNPVKYKDAFFDYKSNYAELPHIFNPLLTRVLNNAIFKDAGFIIFTIVIITYIIWLSVLYIFKIKDKQKKETN